MVKIKCQECQECQVLTLETNLFDTTLPHPQVAKTLIFSQNITHCSNTLMREAAGEEHAGIPWLKMENIRTNGYSIIRGARLFPLNYSHSMVDGGLEDMS